jgi:hypothetical protein
MSADTGIFDQPHPESLEKNEAVKGRSYLGAAE